MAEPASHPYPRPVPMPRVPLLSPIELRSLLAGPEPPILLDVRPLPGRTLAHLPGDRHIPLSELGSRSNELPKDRPLVVYCQFGARAREAVELLQARGFTQAVALEGGLDEYSRVADPSVPRYWLTPTAGELVIRQFPRTESGCLAYLVGDPIEGRAILVDPGIDVAPYLHALSDAQWKLSAIVETHTHADHLAGHHELHRRTDAPIVVGAHSPAAYPHRSLADGEAFTVGRDEVEVLETPGHTRDHVTLRVGETIFTGDTLLIGSCGRTDLGDGDPDLLYQSLTEKILRLPDETEVLPAHYGRRHDLPDRYVSTLGFERATNDALRCSTLESFRTYMTEGWPPKPSDFDRIVEANLR
jgi:glyoxylase-like metal-dependent hydrolase (beta-lactamase superfamily II)/rhodanese-related sulfurtransferase